MRLALAFALLVVLASPAHAEDKKAAERYFRLGAKAYAAQNFQAAATNFDEAFKALPMPEIAFSAAQAYRRLYQVDPKPPYVHRAVELYQFYLGAVKTGGRVGDAADNLLDMKRELAKLEAAGVVATTAPVEAPPATRLGVNVSVPDQGTELGALREIGDATGTSIEGLSVTLDGARVEPFALVETKPGEHVVRVSAAGYYPAEKRGIAVLNSSIFVDVELRPMPAKVTVKTEDGARISIGGRHVATTPTAPVEVPAGTHLLSVLRNGREPFSTDVTVTRGQQLVLDAPLARTSQRKAVPWLFAASGALLAGAVTTGLFARARDGRASDLREQLDMGNRPAADADALDSTVRSRDRFVTWTWILGSAAVATAGVGTFLLVFDRPDANSGTVGVGGTF